MTKIIILVILPLILLLLPKTVFNQGNFTICIFKLLVGGECAGCGLTRACMHFIHFDYAEAYKFNKMVFIIMPILIIAWGYELYKSIKKLRNPNQ
jgi:putative effector of murein hydrolase